jgi:hypothetical protein
MPDPSERLHRAFAGCFVTDERNFTCGFSSTRARVARASLEPQGRWLAVSQLRARNYVTLTRGATALAMATNTLWILFRT